MSLKSSVVAVSLALLTPSAFATEAIEALQKRLDEQQKQIDALSKSLKKTENESTSDDSFFGGYGELHYGDYKTQAPDRGGANRAQDKALDFHRFVLFFGHKFDDNLRFFSELEVEHSLAGEGKPGEVELEQAYIEHQLNDQLHWKGGLFLLPIGIINETHEPPTFYGVERNRVEGDIIPATWWEGGGAATFSFADGFQADVAITGGLQTDHTFTIRSGRQKVAKASADALAYTGRVKYTGIAGLELALSLQYQEDLLQGLGIQAANNVPAQPDETASATLREFHVVYQVAGMQIRALHAQWDIDSDVAEAAGKAVQKGFYIEPSYRFNDTVGAFARYSKWDNGGSGDTEKVSKQVGVNVWIHPNVVIKADHEKLTGATEDKGFNLGVGYHF